MKFKCSKCGNRIISDNAPRFCPITCCDQEDTYVAASFPSFGKANWKCTSCGNKSSQVIAPSICPITCCNASNSYVQIP